VTTVVWVLDRAAASTSQVAVARSKAIGEAMTHPLDQPLDLPCGTTLSNRLAKAATSEGLADTANRR